MNDAAPPLLRLRQVGMGYASDGGLPTQVLNGIDLQLREGEIVGLLGRSGCGKSTLLRIANGILPPTAGTVEYLGRELHGPAAGVAMVFQTFALFPWLTIEQNVAVGLEAQGMARKDIEARVAEAIAMIGLDGFERAYPRELSGGMRQRVGFARAMVIAPSILLMDEPFSALDVLTAETLRTDFLDLWIERQMPTKAVLLVTHNIEEAVLMCDRILLLASHPGRIVAEVPVDLPRPRDRAGNAFRNVVDDIYEALTARQAIATGAPMRILPRATVGQVIGLVQVLGEARFGGSATLASLAEALDIELDTLLPNADALQLLEFAEVRDGRIRLTPAGRVFGQSEAEERKRLFGEHLLEFVPLAAHIRRILDEREDHRVPMSVFLAELETRLTPPEALRALHIVTAWGRYAGIYAYDIRARVFFIP